MVIMCQEVEMRNSTSAQDENNRRLLRLSRQEQSTLDWGMW
jgi:hypothetical protein